MDSIFTWRRIALLAVGCMLVLVIAAMWRVIRAWYSPARGWVYNPAIESVVSPRSDTNIFRGKYLTFEFDRAYTPRSIDRNKDWLEQNYWVAGAISKTLASSIKAFTSDNLNDDSSYQGRRNAPTVYHEEIKEINGQTFYVWTKKSSSEAAAFVKHDGVLAIIALTSSKSNDDVTAELDAVLASLKWLN